MLSRGWYITALYEIVPKEECYYLVFDNSTKSVIIGMFVEEKFESCFPIAWCEIPTFIDKECKNE